MFIIIPVYLGYLFVSKKLRVKDMLISCISTIVFPSLLYGLKFIQTGTGSFSYAFGWTEGHPAPFWQYPIAFIKQKQPIGIFMSFWGYFGWLKVPMSKWIYLLFLLIMLIATVGWIYAVKKKIRLFPTSSKALVFVCIVSISYIATIFLFDFLTFIQKDVFLIQGRYFLPVVFLIVVWIIQGLLVYKDRLRTILLTGSIGIFLISQILMYSSISRFYYHRYAVISPLTKVYLLKKP